MGGEREGAEDSFEHEGKTKNPPSTPPSRVGMEEDLQPNGHGERNTFPVDDGFPVLPCDRDSDPYPRKERRVTTNNHRTHRKDNVGKEGPHEPSDLPTTKDGSTTTGSSAKHVDHPPPDASTIYDSA
eukprot:scaffold221_cov351-Pavlova_lutheri.AAC.16